MENKAILKVILEGIYYFLFYGIGLLIMPFINFLVLAGIFMPVLIIQNITPIGSTPINSIVALSDPIYQLLIILSYVIFFCIYLLLNYLVYKKIGSLKIILFLIFFLGSGLINYVFTLLSCAISALKPCDPHEYYTLTGFLGIFPFYILGLFSYLAIYIYSKFPSRVKTSLIP
jgi:hypothetical protein